MRQDPCTLTIFTTVELHIDSNGPERYKPIYELKQKQKYNLKGGTKMMIANKKDCDFCGSNTGPPDLQSDALPTELKPL